MQTLSTLQTIVNALAAIVHTPHIKAYLEQHDPNALAQVREALSRFIGKTAAVLLGVLLLNASAWAATLDFSGGMRDTTIAGFVTYDETQVVSTNTRGLTPNYVYAVQDWGFTVQSGLVQLPATIHFGNVLEQTIEVCAGQCVFGGTLAANLLLTQPDYRLQLTFDPTWQTFRVESSQLQWQKNGAFYDWMMPVQEGTMTIRDAPLSASISASTSVPLPAMLWPTAGLLGWLLWKYGQNMS